LDKLTGEVVEPSDTTLKLDPGSEKYRHLGSVVARYATNMS
jgi:hypothetical protein